MISVFRSFVIISVLTASATTPAGTVHEIANCVSRDGSRTRPDCKGECGFPHGPLGVASAGGGLEGGGDVRTWIRVIPPDRADEPLRDAYGGVYPLYPPEYRSEVPTVQRPDGSADS